MEAREDFPSARRNKRSGGIWAAVVTAAGRWSLCSEHTESHV